MKENDKAKVRLNLEIPQSVRDRMVDLRNLSDAESLTAVIRRSLAVYDLLLHHFHDGGKVILRSEDGSEETLRILV